MTLLTTAFVDRPLTVSSGSAFAQSYWAENAGPLAAVLTPGHYLINSEVEITVTANSSAVDIVLSSFRPGTLNRTGSDVIIPAGETGVFTAIYDYTCEANTVLVADSGYTHNVALRTENYSTFPAGFEATGRIRFKLSDVNPGCASAPEDDVLTQCVNLADTVVVSGHDTADFLLEFLPTTALDPGLTEDFDAGAQEFNVCSPGARPDALTYYTQFYVRDPEDEWGSAVQYGTAEVFLYMREYAVAPPPLVNTFDVNLDSLVIGDLQVPDLFEFVTVGGVSLSNWLAANPDVHAHIELVGAQQPSIAVEFDHDTNSYGMSLDDDLPLPAPGTYSQPYRVRFYDDEEVQYTDFNGSSDYTGTVYFTLLEEDGGEGGEGGEGGPCPGIAYFSRTMPACN